MGAARRIRAVSRHNVAIVTLSNSFTEQEQAGGRTLCFASLYPPAMRHVPGENEADGPLCAALGGIVATDSELSGANVVGWYVVGNSSEVRTAGPVDLQIDRS